MHFELSRITLRLNSDPNTFQRAMTVFSIRLAVLDAFMRFRWYNGLGGIAVISRCYVSG